MKFMHNGIEVELLDLWWEEAGMDEFVRNSNAYNVIHNSAETPIFYVRIDDVAPVRRSANVCIFNDSPEEGCARTRVVRILRGFRLGEAIPPVQVIEVNPKVAYQYNLINGTHRLYCSLAAGFTHIPAIHGVDLTKF